MRGESERNKSNAKCEYTVHRKMRRKTNWKQMNVEMKRKIESNSQPWTRFVHRNARVLRVWTKVQIQLNNPLVYFVALRLETCVKSIQRWTMNDKSCLRTICNRKGSDKSNKMRKYTEKKIGKTRKSIQTHQDTIFLCIRFDAQCSECRMACSEKKRMRMVRWHRRIISK